ncbi:MAG: hypothetical protein AAB784_00535 [Patescibacteria group bacterium]
MERGNLVTIFARTFRLLNKLSADLNNDFLVKLLDRESENLFLRYIKFLKFKGSASGSSYVVQCSTELIFQIKNILNIVYILKYTKPDTPLLLERNLLLLELTILNFSNKKNTIKLNSHSHKIELRQNKSKSSSYSLSQDHKQIIEFVLLNKRVQNIEVFGKFSGVSKRTLKRKLSELIQMNLIKRFSEGKKVFYGPCE